MLSCIIYMYSVQSRFSEITFSDKLNSYKLHPERNKVNFIIAYLNPTLPKSKEQLDECKGACLCLKSRSYMKFCKIQYIYQMLLKGKINTSCFLNMSTVLISFIYSCWKGHAEIQKNCHNVKLYHYIAYRANFLCL